LAREVVELPRDSGVGYHGSLVLPLLHATGRFGAAILFKGPRSFTGEDVAELHLPNSPALVRACMDRLLEGGEGEVRLAGPGEFSARAFFNGKIDLTEAEGIAATINAHTETELRAAASLRQGHLHAWIADMADRLANLLALIEADIDFVEEEDIRLVDPDTLLSRLQVMHDGLCSEMATAVRADRLDNPPTVLFLGDPNVGKSSLINALTCAERSLTSEIAGTTRDVLSATLHTAKGDIRLLDVPGEELPSDELRRKMMEARQRAILEADLIVHVVTDDSRAISNLATPGGYPAEAVTVQNKADLLPAEVRKRGSDREPWQLVSAKNGLNIDLLREAILGLVTRRPVVSAIVPALNQRHRVLLDEVRQILGRVTDLVAAGSVKRHPELIAADLRRALDLLGQITGTISPDEVLGRIFSQFCIGK
jgi:tRNA modification GTPase